MQRFLLLISVLFSCLNNSASGTDLTRQFPNREITEILVGEGSTYSLRVESYRAISIGVATILVSPNGGKLSFHSALKLADELATKGWHVDVVSPSWLDIPVFSKAMMQDQMTMQDSAAMMDTTMSEASMMKDEKAMKAQKSIPPWMSTLEPNLDFDGLTQHLSTLLTGLSNNSSDISGFRLLIAEGLVAALLLSSSQDNAEDIADAVTLITPFWPQSETNQVLSQLSSTLSIPLLDIGFATSNRFAATTAKQRARDALKNTKLDYRQRQLPITHRQNAIKWVSGEIVGWTRSLGW